MYKKCDSLNKQKRMVASFSDSVRFMRYSDEKDVIYLNWLSIIEPIDFEIS